MDVELKVAFLTVAATAFIAVIGHLFKEYKERSATRHAFLAEVAALAEVARVRGYVEALRTEAREMAEVNKNGVIQGRSFSVPLDLKGYRPIWDAYLTRLGCLKASETEQFVRFYQLLDSVARDVTEGGLLFIGTGNAEDFEHTATVLERALEIADRLSSKRFTSDAAQQRSE